MIQQGGPPPIPISSWSRRPGHVDVVRAESRQAVECVNSFDAFVRRRPQSGCPRTLSFRQPSWARAGETPAPRYFWTPA